MALLAANPTPNIPHWHWPQENEVNLLNAILEIANEPVESYDPGINLFDRINKNMEKSLTDREILDKIKQLKKRFRISCLKLKFGIFQVKRSRVFQISKKIWGKEREMKEMDAKSSKVNPEEGSKPNHKREREPRKKRDGVESKQPTRKKQKKHIARDCSGKKIAKQLTEQEHSEDISKGSVVLQLEAENKCKELSGGSVFVSSLVNPQEASRPNSSPGGLRPNCPQEASGPNCEQEHELTKKQNDAEPNYDQQSAEQNVKEQLCHSCRKSGHIARDSVAKKRVGADMDDDSDGDDDGAMMRKGRRQRRGEGVGDDERMVATRRWRRLRKIAKQPTKNQHTEDISNGSVMLQSRTENKHEELSGGSVFVRFDDSSGANPQEAFRPNCEREHELTMGQNNAEHNYEPQPAKQKIAKQLTKQQETKDISKGPVELQFGEESMCEELSGGSVFVSSKVNPPEASRPNCEREHELTTKCDDAELNYEQQPAEQKVKERFCYICSKFGHTSRDCFDKIAKQMIKSQDGKDVSKGSVELQFEAQNKCEELFGESAVASFQPVSLQPRSEQTWQRDEVPSYSLLVAQEYFWKQRMEVYYRSQPDANQHASCQGMQAFLHRSQQMNPYNGFQPASHHCASDQWMRESVTPPITPQPPNFGPPPPIPPQPPNGGRSLIPPQPPNSGPSLVPPQPPNWGPPLIPPQPPNWGPQPANCGFQPIPQQPANWGPPPIPPQIPQQTANWGPPPIPSQPSNGGVLSIPPQPANWGQPPIPSQPPNCGPSSIYGLPPVPPQPPNGRSPPVPPQHPNRGPPPTPPQFSNWGPPPVTPQPPNWSPPLIPPPPPNWSPPPIPPPPPPNCGLSPVSPQPPNCGPPPQPPNRGLPNPITMPYSYPPPLIPYQYPYN